jgi:hypothetical protein
VAVISGADVSVGRDATVGVKAAAVSVNCEMTVLAAEVRTAATSGVDSDPAGGVADPHAAANMAIKMTITTDFSYMEPPF